MSVKSGTNKFPIDSLTVFRAAGLDAVTATTASTAQAIDFATGYWNNDNDVASLFDYAIEFIVESINMGSGDTYTANVEVATDSAFTSPVVVATVGASATGRTSLIVDRDAVVNALGGVGYANTAGYIRVKVVVGGSTAPSIAWNAYAAPIPAAS